MAKTADETFVDGLSGTDQRRLAPALAVAVLAGVALAASSSLDVVADARPAYLAWPLLVVLALLPAAVSAALAVRGRPSMSAGVLAGVAALAPGRAVIDAQFIVDGSLAARPELAVPGPVYAPPSWLGLGLLFAGHLGAVVAGVLAASASAALPDDSRTPDDLRQHLLVAALATALLLAVGLVLPPFGSDDASLLDTGALDAPVLVLLGVLLLSAATLLTAGLAMAARSWGLARGVLVGLAAGGCAIALPPVAGALAAPWLHLGAGSLVVLAAAAGLVGIALVPWPHVVAATQQAVAARAEATKAEAAAGLRPRQYWLYASAGVLAVLAAAGAIAAARAPLMLAASGRAVANTPAQWLLLPAGAAVGVLGVALLVPRLAVAVRPAAAVAWVAVVLAGTAVLDRAVDATDLPVRTQAGSGVTYTVLAIVAALLLAACAAAAGVVEREDADQEPVGDRLIWPVIAAGVLATGAFGLPAVSGPEYQGSALANGLEVSFWGVLLALLVVLGGLALLPVSRPPRAIAVLLGLLCVLGLRLLEPVVAGAPVAAGAWFAGGCALVLAVMLALTVSKGRRTGVR